MPTALPHTEPRPKEAVRLYRAPSLAMLIASYAAGFASS